MAHQLVSIVKPRESARGVAVDTDAKHAPVAKSGAHETIRPMFFGVKTWSAG